MKNIKIAAIALIATITFASCQKDEIVPMNTQTISSPVNTEFDEIETKGHAKPLANESDVAPIITESINLNTPVEKVKVMKDL